MKISMLIGSMMIAAGLAGVSAPAHAEGSLAGRWRGLLLRNGLQVPIAVELANADGQWSGRMGTDATSTRLKDVRVKLTSVHFEVPGEGSFDGTAAGDSMAGSVSGAAAGGSFALARETDSPFDPFPSGP